MSALALEETMWECFRHFVHLDMSNAAVHTAEVRYSPLTFRLAEHLHQMGVHAELSDFNAAMLTEVIQHRGRYLEDVGR